MLRYRLGVELYWADAAVEQIDSLYYALPAVQLRPDQPVVDFMREKCDFKMEHADGSFLDHLRFCFECGFAPCVRCRRCQLSQP